MIVYIVKAEDVIEGEAEEDVTEDDGAVLVNGNEYSEHDEEDHVAHENEAKEVIEGEE